MVVGLLSLTCTCALAVSRQPPRAFPGQDPCAAGGPATLGFSTQAGLLPGLLLSPLIFTYLSVFTTVSRNPCTRDRAFGLVGAWFGECWYLVGVLSPAQLR